MKKIITRIILLIVLCHSNFMIAQIQPTLLIGSWSFDFETSVNKMELKEKQHYEEMSMDFKEKISQAYRGRKLIFNNDGTFLQKQSDNKEVSGSWKLTPDQKNIVLTNLKGQTLSLKIKKLSNNVLVIKPESEAKGQMILSEWNFIKN